MRFTQFNFHPNILSAISVAGYTNPTPIQKQTIPPILQGKDVLGLAQTGRADQSGQAYTFASVEDGKMIALIEKALGKKMTDQSFLSV